MGKTVSISVRNLVEFILRSGDIDERRGQGGSVDAMLEGARIHRAIQAAAGSDYTAEVPVKETIALSGELSLVVEGRADGVIDNQGYITIDEIKGMYLDVLKLAEPYEVHLAQAKCYAAIWAGQHGLSDISVRMTYVGIEDRHIKLFNFDYTYEELKKWFDGLIESYRPWAEHIADWMELRERSIRSLEFPYVYRAGQKELAADVYKTVYHGKKLFLEAPTGTGKTLAVLYPSIKAMGEGFASYIFYLTAKNIGAKACSDALELMRKKGGLRLKSVHIMGKDRACLNSVTHCNPQECAFARGHFDRVNEALYELLTTADAFTREEIEREAVRREVCPYALARDLTEFSDCIICDYNYVFDSSVALRHFFGEGKKTGGYLFLIDEAHNLVERARDMYSADLSLRQLGYVKNLIRGIDRRLSSYLNALIGQLDMLKEEHEASGKRCIVRKEAGETGDAASRLAGRFLELMQERHGNSNESYDKSGGGQMALEDTLPDKTENTGVTISEPAGGDRKADRFGDEVIEFYFDLLHFNDVYDRLDRRYRIYSEMTESGDMRLRLLCVDPSHNLSEYLAYGRASVFFSATLLPVTYYMDLLVGSRDDYTVYASSVFDPDRLGVFIDTGVTSRYARRGIEEYRKIAGHIREIISCRRGNYMVFFPSYSFLEAVYDEYVLLSEKEDGAQPDTSFCICQKEKMSEQDREDFLGEFSDEGRGVTGFCVMGGLFAEGIDLTGERLIGAIIVGTGLPQISNEKDILKRYFDDNGRDGYDYAMKIPGMNKVLQAAGRVIRTESDTGVVALLDERFDRPDHRRMYPREWKNIKKITGGEFKSVREFWEDHIN
ncbi:MAG: ATP-dependent DNA helicase [Lachnospiraceae bacterium]|nr:ATP-dependent DNA helicase [Lachnospiraceae bacterium]